MFDIIVIGGGPAGLTAAIYGRRAGKSVLIIEKNTFGGQITWSPKVDNFPALSSVSGLEFADRLMTQAIDHGAEPELDEVTEITRSDAVFSLTTASGVKHRGRSVIVATGASPRRLGIEREDSFIGSGISYCAVCDGEFYKGRPVAVSGGGNSALGEALYLSDTCAKVFIVHRRDSFRADNALVSAVKVRGNIECVYDSHVVELHGKEKLTTVTVSDKSGQQRKLEIGCLFVAIGHEPANGILNNLTGLTDSGYADSDERCLTACPGVFVAGDIRAKELRQLTTAVADGAVAALAACRYIDTSAV